MNVGTAAGANGAANHRSAGPSGRRHWPKFIVGLLVAHTAAMIGFVVVATRDPDFSVDPNYYQKAVRWDEDQAARRASEALGWRATVQPSATAGTDGMRAVGVELVDPAGAALPGAAVDVSYFHHAHGRDVRSAPLPADPLNARRFTAVLHMPHAGIWEFQITARAGGQTFLKTVTVEVP